MQIIKYIILFLVLTSSSYIGVLISKKYKNRVIELKEMKSCLAIFATKIKLTYEPIPEIFLEIGNKEISEAKSISNIFKAAAKKMEELPAGKSWIEALENQTTNLKKEDIEILKGLSNLLGKVDIEGQINEIELVDNFLDTQIEKAEEESKKSVKMYKTLGVTIGLAMVIVLI